MNTKPMNALLTNSLADGGAERIALTVISELIKRGHNMILICLEKNVFYDIPEGVDVIYLSNLSGNEGGLQKFLRLPFLAVKLMKVIKKYNIQVVQSHLFRSNYVNVMARQLGARHKVQVLNSGSISPKYSQSTLTGRMNLFLIHRLYPKADVIISLSKGSQVDMQELFNFSVPKRVIYNPTQPDLLENMQKEQVTPKEFLFQTNHKYIISMGRLHPCKCFDMLIQAFETISNQFKDTDLIILGEGDEKKKLSNCIDTLNLTHRIFLTGRVRNPFKYLARAHLFILPSINEGFPNSLVEAMLCKLPVISTDCLSGPREILAPETDVQFQLKSEIEFAQYGVLTPVNNHLLLADAMTQLLQDQNLSKKYIELGYKRACMFSLDNIIDQYEKVIFSGDC